MTFDLSGCLSRTMMAVRSPFLGGASRRTLPLLACLMLLPANGCLGHHYVKTDFKSYENAFAETSNREMLLNLARLDQRDPAYFFKMGQITSSYRMQGSLLANGQLSSGSNAVQIPVGGGSPGVIFENDPTFQFIPVNDDTNARLLISPIQPETFYALYQQGWRLDQLFRLLVDRIEVSVPVSPEQQTGQAAEQNNQTAGVRQSNPTECRVEVFRNLPPEGEVFDGTEPLAQGQVRKDVTGPDGSVLGYYVEDAQGKALYSVTKNKKDGKMMRYDAVALSHYVSFLRVSALVYELQKRGLLVLRGNNAFVPYDRNAMIASASEKPPPSKPGAGPSGPQPPGNAGAGGFQAKDQNDAHARNDIWQKVQRTNPDGSIQEGWELGRMVFTPVFYLTPIVVKTENGATTITSDTVDTKAQLESALQTDPDLSALLARNEQKNVALQTLLDVMKSGFSLEGMPTAEGETQQNVCPSVPTAHLYMRSIIELMAASAQEQSPWESLDTVNPVVPKDPQNPAPQSPPQPFQDEVPRLEQMPILTLQWDSLKDTANAVASVSYHGNTYVVTDRTSPAVAANASWNRDMFRLIEGLSSQVTVDISKFPLPEILQLHSD